MSFKYGYMAQRSAFSLTPAERQGIFLAQKAGAELPDSAAHSHFIKSLANRDVC